jgi:hypothetical protein
MTLLDNQDNQRPSAPKTNRGICGASFGTLKARMGATHFLTKTLPKVAAEMALSVLPYNLTEPYENHCSTGRSWPRLPMARW